MREYVSPRLDILEFDMDDVITASSPSDSPVEPVDPVEPAATETENAYGGMGEFDQKPPGGWF